MLPTVLCPTIRTGQLLTLIVVFCLNVIPVLGDDGRRHLQRARADVAVGRQRGVRSGRQVDRDARDRDIRGAREVGRGDPVLDVRVADEDHAHAFGFEEQVEIGEGRATVETRIAGPVSFMASVGELARAPPTNEPDGQL